MKPSSLLTLSNSIGVLFSAACLCLLIIIPFAVWGQQIFGSGLFFKCNDSSVTTKFECAGEFVGAAVSDWTFPQPRVWTNFDLPSFDNFGSALLLLFELLSLEGWIDAMIAAISINGQDQQPQSGAATYYAIFFGESDVCCSSGWRLHSQQSSTISSVSSSWPCSSRSLSITPRNAADPHC